MKIISKTDKGDFICKVEKDELKENFIASNYSEEVYFSKGSYYREQRERLDMAISKLSDLLEAKNEILKIFLEENN